MTPLSFRQSATLQVYADPTEMPTSEASRIAMLLAIDEADILSDAQLARIVSGGLLPASAIALADVRPTAEPALHRDHDTERHQL